MEMAKHTRKLYHVKCDREGAMIAILSSGNLDKHFWSFPSIAVRVLGQELGCNL
jgi:hypothetical protein